MNNQDDVIHHYTNEFEQAKNSLPGNDLEWLQKIRLNAFNRFTEKGFPTRKDEAWKYTNIQPIVNERFTMQHPSRSTSYESSFASHLFNDTECHLFPFVNGRYFPDLINTDSSAQDFHFSNLATALHENSSAIQTYLRSIPDERQYAFSALNLAFMMDGLFLHIPKHAVIEKPIYLLYFQDEANQSTHIRNVIIAEENSQFTIVEHFIGKDNIKYFSNVITQLAISEHAKVEHCKLQQEGQNGFHIDLLDVQQKQNSHLIAHSFSLGGALVRSDSQIHLDEEHTDTTLNGLYIAKNKQHIDHHTVINHHKQNGTSCELYKGILSDEARGVFNGKVYVAQGANKINASQKNQNLLLSQRAEINTKPQLEIFADDVKCSHGATVGQLDEHALFYLRSRGIDLKSATILLTHAFADEMAERIIHPSVKDKIKNTMKNKL